MTKLRRPPPSVLLLLAAAVPGLTLHAQMAPPDSGVLRVDVVAKGDEPSVEAPYVAVVPETSPWSEPLREAVIGEGSSVTWALPPGRYRVAAGAPGTTVEYGQTIALAEDTRHHERLELTRLPVVEGRVVDENGEPLPGATVAHLRRLVHDFPRRLSPLGEEHLRGAFESTAGEDGRFEVRLHPEAGSYLAVQAEDRAPRFLPNLRLGTAASILERLTLAAGGSVEARWTAPAPAGSRYDRIQLISAGRDLPPGLDPPLALAVWSRPFPERGRAAWPSLPPGRYEIWIKAPPRGTHEDVPLRLGEVALTAGERAEVRLELPPESITPEAGRVAGSEAAGDLEVLLPTLPPAELETLEVRGWWSAEPDGPRMLPFTAKAASGGTLVRVEGACRPGASLALVTGSRVGSVAVAGVHCKDDRPALRVALAPRADLDLRVSAPPGERLPAIARFSIGPCVPPGAPPRAPASEPPVRLELAAAIELEEGLGSIRSPTAAGCTSVTARIGDFAALDWPDLEAEPGATVDLGAHRLRSGAALLARVFSAADGRPLDGVTVRAIDPDRAIEELRGAGGRANGETQAAGAQGDTAVTSRGGWARLYGLPPGRDLVVLLQGEGRRPHPATDVRLAPGEERMLDALELPPPASVEIRIELSRRLEEVEAVPYQVFLRQTGADGPPLSLSRDVGPERIVVLKDLSAGTWRIEGIARAADGKPFPAGSTEVELADGESRIVELELADSIYEGRVTYEGIPVEGSLSVSPVSPADRRGMSVLLDEDGRFQLPVEGPGIYTVRVFDERDRRFDEATLAAVELDDPDEEVRIRVPEGRIGGVVTDADGAPVPGSVVRIESRQDLGDGRFFQTSNTARGNRAGEFLLEGLSAGAWTVRAEAGDLASEARMVELAPDERVETLELVVEPKGRVSGVVRGADGLPAAGAQLAITPQPDLAVEVPPFLRAATDAEGRFELSTASAGSPANVRIVTADGRAAALRTVLREELRIDLPAMSGEIEISLPCSLKRAGISGTRFLVSPGGAFFPLPALGRAERVSSEPCRTVRRGPGLAAGSWRIVQVNDPAEEALLFAGAGAMLRSRGELTALPGAPATVQVEEEHRSSSLTETLNER